MNISGQLAKHFRDVHFGGNWTCSSLKETLSGISWEQAIEPVHSFNTIATLTFHVHYFVEVLLKVLQGGPLQGNDKLSFDHPPITCAGDWEQMQLKIWTDAERAALLIEQLPVEKLSEWFAEQKYGTYYRNIAGIIEHTHYHLGQIALIRKILADKKVD